MKSTKSLSNRTAHRTGTERFGQVGTLGFPPWTLRISLKSIARPRTKASWDQVYGHRGCAESQKSQKIIKFWIFTKFWNFHNFHKILKFYDFGNFQDFQEIRLFWEPPPTRPHILHIGDSTGNPQKFSEVSQKFSGISENLRKSQKIPRK